MDGLVMNDKHCLRLRCFPCFRIWILLVVSLQYGCSSQVAAAEGGSLPAHMMDDIIRFVPQSMAMALNMLDDTLKHEADRALRMRNFGREGRATRSSFKHVQSFLGSTPYGKHLSYPSFVQTKTLSILRTRFNLNNGQVKQMMSSLPPPLHPNPHVQTPDTPFPRPRADTCPYPTAVQCDAHAPYRTYDGTCNNLERPLWGASHQPLARFLPPDYADAIDAPRVSVTGSYLPSPRLVSTTVHWDIDVPQHLHTLMVMQFGQFVDHDLSRTAISKLTMYPSGYRNSFDGFDDLEDVECGFDGCQTEGLENQACIPIPVPLNDTDFHGQRCLMFVRSQEVPNAECSPGSRQQLNQLTSLLDASHIYGSTKGKALDLRDISQSNRGFLKMHRHPGGSSLKNLLPQDPNFKDCKGDNRTRLCFKAGDGRVNEFMGLTSMHTVYAREHNRVESILHQLNPHWGGERLYQESRRIVNAQWQHQVYNELLPVILGPDIVQQYGLQLADTGYWNGYDPKVNPSVTNSFATAAMRFGHTLIQGDIKLKDINYRTREEVPISTLFRRPQILYRPPVGGLDALLRASLCQSSQTRDSFVTKQVTAHLFADNPPNGKGEDLMSLNIMRGRDHGLPGYTAFREWCGLPRGNSFYELSSELPAEVIERFRRLYKHVDDIDLWPAAISEFSLPSSTLGPTFACLIAAQFRNLRSGDRFWFESQNQPRPFTPDQLQEIRKSSVAKLICTNTDSIPYIQPKVLIHPLSEVHQKQRQQNKAGNAEEFRTFYGGDTNERVACERLPDMDLRAWQEVAPFQQQPPQQPSPSNAAHPNSFQHFPPPPPHPSQNVPPRLPPLHSAAPPHPNSFGPPRQTAQRPPPPQGPQQVPPPQTRPVVHGRQNNIRIHLQPNHHRTVNLAFRLP